MHRLLPALLVVAACGAGGAAIDSPCDLADAAMVQAALGGTVSEGVEGDFLNCDFSIVDGPALSVSVYDFGTAGGWDDARQGFVDNRGGVTDIEELGHAAFYPNDVGAGELVVQAGGRIFSVSLFTGFDEPGTGAINGLANLAEAIAADLEG